MLVSYIFVHVIKINTMSNGDINKTCTQAHTHTHSAYIPRHTIKVLTVAIQHNVSDIYYYIAGDSKL